MQEKIDMIDYSPFWATLKDKNENWYTLTNIIYRTAHCIV